MKLNLKAIAVAAAMLAGGAAHADLLNNSTGNSSFAMLAFNTVTNAYYVRDLGYTLNTFLPSSVTTLAGDGGVTGNKTPDAGVNIVWATDANWATFLGSSSLADIKWTVAAGDGLTANSAQGVSRNIVALSQTPSPTPTNTTVRNAAGTSTGVSGLASQNNDGTSWYSKIGSTVLTSFLNNTAFGAATLSSLDVASSLFYYAATASTGSSSATPTPFSYANALNTATLTLASNGVFTYDLQPAVVSAVPLPGAAWLMGAGLMAIGGMVRRRKAAAEA